MSSKFHIGMILVVLLILSLACGLGSAGDDWEGNLAEEPYYEDEAPAMEAPTITPEPTATLMTTQLPSTGAGGDDPAPTPVAVSMDLNSVYARVIESLPQGSALFNPPATMKVGDVELVEVRVVPMTEEEIEQDEQIKATLTSNLDEVDEIVVVPLRVSTVMSARLTGTEFDILPLTAEEKVRTSDDLYLSWVWEVTPQKAGEQTLTLYLSVVVNADGMGDKTHTTDEIRVVQVEANPFYSVKQFFGTNWEWVATGLLFPALGWAWRRFRGLRNP